MDFLQMHPVMGAFVAFILGLLLGLWLMGWLTQFDEIDRGGPAPPATPHGRPD